MLTDHDPFLLQHTTYHHPLHNSHVISSIITYRIINSRHHCSCYRIYISSVTYQTSSTVHNSNSIYLLINYYRWSSLRSYWIIVPFIPIRWGTLHTREVKLAELTPIQYGNIVKLSKILISKTGAHELTPYQMIDNL